MPYVIGFYLHYAQKAKEQNQFQRDEWQIVIVRALRSTLVRRAGLSLPTHKMNTRLTVVMRTRDVICS